jgi:hypothetical protein
MRDIVIFLLLIVAVFIGIGEWRGWYLGVPGTHARRRVQDGPPRGHRRPHRHPLRHADPHGGSRAPWTVTVEVTHERPASFQTGEARSRSASCTSRPSARARGSRSDVFEAGRGIYRVRVTYADVSGTFRFTLPAPSEL